MMTERMVSRPGHAIFPRVPLDIQYPFVRTELQHNDPDTTAYDWLYSESTAIHPLAQQSVRIGLPTGTDTSIAIVDWSAMHHAVALLEDARSITDPFIAILDFTAILAALIFYDYTLVLDYNNVAARANQVFQLDGIVRGIDPIGASLGRTSAAMKDAIERWFLEAQMELERATDQSEPWIAWLQSRWARLLPNNEFPKHDFSAYKELHGVYDLYEGSGLNTGWNAIFELKQNTYRSREGFDYGRLILDNDRRSLFYEFLLEQVRIHLDAQRTMSFRYIANALRSPMQLTRSQLAHDQLKLMTPSPEDWLQQEWARLGTELELNVRVPFWLQAVLAGARRQGDIPSTVSRIRTAAAKLRRHKSALEEALFVGDQQELTKLRMALQGRLDQVTEIAAGVANTALEIADAGAKALLPVPFGPKSIAGLVTSVTPGWFRKNWLRLFKPQLWIIYDLGRQATRVTNIFPVVFERFDLRPGLASAPLRFVDRWGELAAML